MANHYSILAWEIPCIEEPGRLQSVESQRVRHGSATERKYTAQYYKAFRQHLLISYSALGTMGEMCCFSGVVI